MIIIKQEFIESQTNKTKIIDIGVVLDERRPENSGTVHEKAMLVGYLHNWDAHRNNRPQSRDDEVSYDPTSGMLAILDTKRTNPMHSGWTYLTRPSKENSISVFDIDALGIQENGPIAILSDLNGGQVSHVLVEKKVGNEVYFYPKLDKKYFVGAFVQNMADRWQRYPLAKGTIGLASMLNRPSVLGFSVRREGDILKFMIQDLINVGRITHYDIYVRDRSFKYIEPHWIPDVVDQPIEESFSETCTFNGGEHAGGGILSESGTDEFARTYHAAVVAKDAVGRVNVNESGCMVEKIDFANYIK